MSARAGRLAACLASALLGSGGCNAQPQKAANQPSTTSAETAAAPPASATGGIDAGRAFAHLEKLVGFGPHPPGSPAIGRVQQYIRGELASDGCTIEQDDFHASTPMGPVAMENIVAKIPGRGPGIVLLLTHYDNLRLEGFVGADDSGSSTALMLEMARLLCGRSSSEGRPLSVWIGFLDGEEAFVQWSNTDGTYGSRELAAKLALSRELRRVKAVLLADMIGERDLAIRRESNSTAWLTDLVWSTAARLGYRRYFLDDSTTIEDDHIPFLRRGVPAVDIIDIDYPYWHTTADTLDKVSPQSMAIVGHVLLATLDELQKRAH